MGRFSHGLSKKAGFRSGTVFGKYVKASGRHTIRKIGLPLRDFSLGNNMLSGIYTSVDTVLSGSYTFGWNASQTAKAVTQFTTPSELPRNTRADVNIYWASSGVLGAGAVVFNLDYRPVSLFISGTTAVSGINYVTSGVLSKVTGTHIVVAGATQTTMQKTILSIPKTDIEGASFTYMDIYRGGTGDTYTQSVQVIAVDVEFVEL